MGKKDHFKVKKLFSSLLLSYLAVLMVPFVVVFFLISSWNTSTENYYKEVLNNNLTEGRKEFEKRLEVMHAGAFSLVADGGPSEGAEDELRSRFLQSPHTVLAYLVLMGDQSAPHAQDLTAAEVVCRRIASADAAWYGGTEEFAKTMETCRTAYPSGPAAHLLDTLEAEQKASLERNG